MTTVKELLMREEFFDAAVLRHGFTDYMRDYELIISGRNGPPNTDLHKYQFIGCVEAQYQTNISPDGFVRSLSDQFVYAGPDYPGREEPDGFIWGVRYSNAYPGLKYIEEDKHTEYWSERLGRKMHEITLVTEAFTLRLVFADIRYLFLGNETSFNLAKDYPIPPNEITSDGGIQ